MSAFLIFLKKKIFFLIIIGFAASVAVIIVTTVSVIDANEKKDQVTTELTSTEIQTSSTGETSEHFSKYYRNSDNFADGNFNNFSD